MILKKIMLLGDMAVGKTSIANRLVFDRMPTDYKSTIGIDIYRYDVDLGPNEKSFQFLVWDTDGNIGDAMFRDKQMKGAHAAVVVRDLTRRDTMVHQLQLAQKFSDEFPGRYLVGVLNKTDLNNDVPEDKDHIPEGLRKGFFPICHTSAKTGENVAQTFVDAAKTIVRRNL
jgi:small GTP-binding protein